jgi:hydrogenase nickel incorporation protein HypB
MFRASELVLLSKVDLLPHLRFDVAEFLANVRTAAPRSRVIAVSATTGEGLEGWYDWLRERLAERGSAGDGGSAPRPPREAPTEEALP